MNLSFREVQGNGCFSDFPTTLRDTRNCIYFVCKSPPRCMQNRKRNFHWAHPWTYLDNFLKIHIRRNLLGYRTAPQVDHTNDRYGHRHGVQDEPVVAPRAKTTVPEAASKVPLWVILLAIHFFTWQKVSV